jgi:hypothetical protein
VFTDIEKFGRLLMFGWKARKPYLLSLNDFLPPSSLLRVDKKFPDTDDLGLIRLALGNLARVLSVILGESLGEFNESLKPAVDMLEVLTMQTVPTSYICYQISMGLEIVMKKMKKGTPPPGEPDMYRKIGAFRGFVEAEMMIAAKRMPAGDNVSILVNHFLTSTHSEIDWTDPEKKGKEDSKGSVVGEKRSAASDNTNKTTSDERKERRGSDGNRFEAGSGTNKGKNSSRSTNPLCPPHLLNLLGVRGKSGHVIWCENGDAKASSCKLGRHLPDLKQVKLSEARECIEQHMRPEFRHKALGAHAEVVKNGGYES